MSGKGFVTYTIFKKENFSFDNIPLDESLTVPINQQMIVFQQVTISGELVLEGDLVLIDDGSL
jgi:hypothetical protein